MGETDYLVVQPSLFNGIARSIDLFGLYTEYNYSNSTNEADTIALYNDWKAIGKDLEKVINDK